MTSEQSRFGWQIEKVVNGFGRVDVDGLAEVSDRSGGDVGEVAQLRSLQNFPRFLLPKSRNSLKGVHLRRNIEHYLTASTF